MATDLRVERLERDVEGLTLRLDRLEAGAAAEPAGPALAKPPASRPRRPTTAWAPPAAARPAAERVAVAPPSPGAAPSANGRRALADRLGGTSLEDLLGGRVLAWVGGLAVLMGVAFLFAVAVSRGWIDEAARTLVAGSGSAALLALGVFLFERRGRSDSALAAVATGVAALFVTLTVAAQVYDLLPAVLALLLAVGVGCAATALAVRWESKGIAALGIVGGLLAPILAGAPADLTTLAILLVAAASAVGVLVRRRWAWLAVSVIVITLPQWLSFVFGDASVLETLVVLAGFGAMGAAAAGGYEWRVAGERLCTTSAFLLGLNAVVLALAGWLAFEFQGEAPIGRAWLAALAGAHIAIGVAAQRLARTVHDFGLLALVIGVVVADVAFALAVEGPGRALGFAGASVLFAALVRRRGLADGDRRLSAIGLGVHVTLALMQALTNDAPYELLADGGLPAAGAATSLVGVASACFVSARLADSGHRDLRIVLDALGLAVAAYLTALTLDGAVLVVAWSAEAAALARLGRRDGDPVAMWGARAHLLLGLAVALAHVVTPVAIFAGEAQALAEVTGGADRVAGALVLAALALGAAACARLASPGEQTARVALDGLALTLGVLILALLLDGAALALALAAGAVVLCGLADRAGYADLAFGGLTALGLALLQGVVNLAPPSSVSGGPDDQVAALLALGCGSAAAAVCARVGPGRYRTGLEVAAIACLAYLAVVSLDGAALILALCAASIGFAQLSWRATGRTCAGATLAYLGMAVVHAVTIEAPPTALVDGLAEPRSAAMALGAIALAGGLAVRLGSWTPRWREGLGAGAALSALYLASVLVVTPLGSGAPGAEGQVLLSALWSMVGVAALVVGLRRDLKLVRLGALALLLVAVGKVFLYDLATLTSLYRVVSFVALGLLLLLAGFVWERVRPKPVPDMREVPEGVR